MSQFGHFKCVSRQTISCQIVKHIKKSKKQNAHQKKKTLKRDECAQIRIFLTLQQALP